ncbi:MAG: hypothetical protein JNK87_12130 [Bryobacterales bacterium]|nr:hypothetical protein [Bryobacterales bacterium]
MSLSTTFVSNSAVTAVVPRSLLASARVTQVTVVNPIDVQCAAGTSTVSSPVRFEVTQAESNLSVNPSRITLRSGVVPLTDNAPQALTGSSMLSNRGPVAYSFTASTGNPNIFVQQLVPAPVSWLTVTPTSGRLEAFGSTRLDLSVYPAGFRPGTYTSYVTIVGVPIAVTPAARSERSAATTEVLTIEVVLVVEEPTDLEFVPDTLNLTAPQNGVASGTSILTSTGTAALDCDQIQDEGSSGTGWFSYTRRNAGASCEVGVTATAGTLSPGLYVARLKVRPSLDGRVATLTVNFTVTAADATITPSVLTITCDTLGEGNRIISQPLRVNSPVGAELGFAAIGSSFGSWLEVSPGSARTTANLEVTCDPNQIPSYPALGTVRLSPTISPERAVRIPVRAEGPRGRRVLPYLVDGGGDASTLVLVNSDRNAATVQLSFYRTNGGPEGAVDTWTPGTAAGVNTSNFTLAPGEVSRIPLTVSNGQRTTGWVEVGVGQADVNGWVSVRSADGRRETLTGLLAQNLPESVVPFDNRNGSTTSLVITNASADPGGAQVRVRDAQGNVIRTVSRSLAARGQDVFRLSEEIPESAGRMGVIEVAQLAGQIYPTGLIRSAGGDFGVAPQRLNRAAKGRRTTPLVADGGGFWTEITILNTSSTQAVITLRFRRSGGTGSSEAWRPELVDDAGIEQIRLNPRGSYRVITQGAGQETTFGWAELICQQSVAAFSRIIQPAEQTNAETMLGWNHGNPDRFLMPFDTSLGTNRTTYLLSNISADQPATVELLFRSRQGTLLRRHTLPPIPPQGYSSIDVGAQFESLGQREGYTEFDVKTGVITASGLRSGTGSAVVTPLWPVSTARE